jgi:hypothetical protein
LLYYLRNGGEKMSEFLVWGLGEDQEEALEIEAVDHEEAAELWAEITDRRDNNYHIAGEDQSQEVFVLLEGEISPQRFSVCGWFQPTYLVREIV